MTCEAYEALLVRHIAGEATPEEEAEMHRHEAGCPACAAQRAALDGTDADLRTLAEEIPPMPEGLHTRWAGRFAQPEPDAAADEPMTQRKHRNWWRGIAVAAALVFVVGGAIMTKDSLNPRGTAAVSGAAARKTADSTYGGVYDGGAPAPNLSLNSYQAAGGVETEEAMVYDFEEEIEEEPEFAPAEETPETGSAREKKIIRNVSLSMTTRAFEESLSALRQGCENAGGWIAQEAVSTNYSGLRTASLTLRIPAEQLDSFLSAADSAAQITSRMVTASDVTDSYYDTKSRLESERVLLARLQALAVEAADLSDLLELESKISETQYTIDRLEGSLRSTDRQVSDSTVSITLREEAKAEAVQNEQLSLGDRISHAFSVGLEWLGEALTDLCLFLVAALPFLLIIAVLIAAAVLIRRGRKRKDGKAKQ